MDGLNWLIVGNVGDLWQVMVSIVGTSLMIIGFGGKFGFLGLLFLLSCFG